MHASKQKTHASKQKTHASKQKTHASMHVNKQEKTQAGILAHACMQASGKNVHGCKSRVFGKSRVFDKSKAFAWSKAFDLAKVFVEKNRGKTCVSNENYVS